MNIYIFLLYAFLNNSSDCNETLVGSSENAHESF